MKQTATARHCPGSRATAILGLFALALLQIAIAVHQFQHSADHGLNVCHVCTAYSQLEESPGSAATATDVEVNPHGLLESDSESFRPPWIATAYRSRAPPHS